MKIKKGMAILLSLLMVLPLAAAALAENTVRLFYDAAVELLFETSNVTLNGQAEFSLDGVRFKTADLFYIQDYDNSCYQLNLYTPRRDGSDGPDRESGYTVIANGEDVYVMEVFYPGVYKTGSMSPQSTILRKSVQMNLMADLVRVLADQADTLFGEKAVTVQPDGRGGKMLRIVLEEDVPDMVNTALNVFYQFVAKRYFETDYDQVSERFMVPMDVYLTVTQAILGATKQISLKKTDVTAVRDSTGNLEQVKGDVSLLLNTGKDGTRQLDISFSLNVSDRDGSHVGPFDPEEYGVTRKGLPEEPESQDEERVDFDAEQTGLLLEGARAFCAQCGYTLDPDVICAAYQENGWINIDLQSPDGAEHLFYYTDPDGKLIGLHHVTNAFQQVNMDEYHFDEYPDMQLVTDASEKALQYLEEVNPEVRQLVDKVALDWWYETDGELFFTFHEDPLAQDWDGFLIVVRVKPEWRIEYFSITSNG